ncbi:MAG TPA: DUF3426 domain-containing protein, partial [Candidatus Deferrimicrobiaceae bacterium]
MIIECPACRTRFRLDEAKIKGRGARVRCRRCGEPIVVLKPEEPQPEAAKEAGGSLLDLRSVVRESMGEKPEEAPVEFTPPAEISAGKDETAALPVEAPSGMDYPSPDAVALPPASEEEAVPPLPDLAVEFRPEEKIDIDLPAEPPKEERVSDFLMGGGETLDFLKEESVKAEKAEMFDISTSLRKEPLELLSTTEAEEARPSAAAYERAEEALQAAPLAAAAAESPPAGEIAPTVLTEPQDAGEALRPKPPAQRKAASPLLRPSLLALVLLFVALAGGGAYLGFTKGGQDLLRGLVPGMESLWLRSAGKPGPQFDVRNLIGYYETNTKAGNLFIIKGQVANMGRTRKSGIRVHAALLDGKDQSLAEKTAFAGTVLPGEALRTSTREKIEEALSNRFGEKLVNMDVAPGKSVPFMVVFFNAPEGIGAYRLEAKDSD